LICSQEYRILTRTTSHALSILLYTCLEDHIEFDHNDELEDVEDHLIFSKNEYNLTMKDNGKTDWYVGVKNVVDEKSTDLWASVVGWYVATIDGQEQSFSLLSGK